MPTITTSTTESEQVSRTGVTRGTSHTVLRRVVLLAVVYAFSACLAVNTMTLKDAGLHDLWWHLSTGAWIVHHHTVPKTDPFSAHGQGKPWVAYGWLFELLIYGLYKPFGLMGVAGYVVAASGGIGLALYGAIRRRMDGFAAPIALGAIGAFTMTPMYAVRPWLLSILFFVVEMDILFAEVVDEPRVPASRRVWALPLLFVLWANIHIQFIYGLAVLVLAALTEGLALVRGAKGLKVAVASTERRHRLWLVTVLSFLATLANPYGWRLYAVVLGLARQQAPYNVISELVAPDFRSPFGYILVLVVMGAAFVLGRARLRGNLFAGVLLICSALVSFRAYRDEWFALTVALLIIASGLGRQMTSITPMRRRHQVAAATLAVLLLFAWAKKRDLSNARLEANAAKVFPVGAADFVSRRHLAGPLFNSFNWGGYLIWRLPDLPVTIDGRMNVDGDALITRSVDTWSCQPGWESDPDLNAAGLVIGSTEAPLSAALSNDPEFELVYRDAVAVVFVRRTD